jgi:hypothetical protein
MTRWVLVYAIALFGCGTRTGLALPLDDGSSGGGPNGSSSGSSASGGPNPQGDGGPRFLPDGAPADGCGDTQTNPANCGACGHDCEGGACVQGVCQPFVLEGEELFPNTIAADGARVYWVNQTDPDYGKPPKSALVRSVSRMGGAPVTLETLTPGIGTSLHQDGKYLYFYRWIQWTVGANPYNGSVTRLCSDGSCPSISLSGPVDDSAWNIALDASRIYFPTSKTGGLSQIDKGGSAPTPAGVFTTFFLNRLAVDDTYVYAVAVPNAAAGQTQPVMAVRFDKTKAGGPEPIMKDLIEGGDVAVDADNVYVTNTKQVFRIAKKGDPTPKALTPELKPGFITIDSDRIYWLEYANPSTGAPSSLHWVRKDGTGLGSMSLANSATYGPGIALDDKALYWVATISGLEPPNPPKGAIIKVVKPL